MSGGLSDDARVGEQAELLQLFLRERDALIDTIQGLLNAQRKPIEYLQEAPLLSRHFEDCFFALPAVAAGRSRLRGQLQEAHWASGFRPRVMPGLHNDLVDPGQMMLRAFHLWRGTRWPGRNGRLRFAHTLFNLYLLRNLELLVMRVWDAGADRACGRLAQVQDLLDLLWSGAPADQPVLVRDARWLIPMAQSPTTNELAPYFEVLQHIDTSLPEASRIETHRAGVAMAGGHLRSQLRHHLMSGHASLDETALVLTSRNSNALDFAMLVQGLVPLLAAYESACRSGARDERTVLADVICQGLSADPELYVNRPELLAPYTMIEHLFVTTDATGFTEPTPMGARHVQLLREYADSISRLAPALLEDCTRFRPVAGTYSPYALIYGFSSNLTEHITLKTLQTEVVTRFTLEDVFAQGDAETLAWVNGWRKLPHIDAQVQRLFEYPQQFAEDVFGRIERALQRRVDRGSTDPPLRTGRLFIVSAGDAAAEARSALVPTLPARFVVSSDPQLVTAQQAHACDAAALLRDRQEGMFAVSYETPGGWVAVSKDVLTDILGRGEDTKIVGLPATAAAVLKLMCSGLVADAHAQEMAD